MALVVPRVSDEEVQRALDALERKVDAQGGTFAASVAIVFAAVGTTEKNVRHGLDRVPIGWRVIDIDAAATVHRSGKMTASVIPITASATANIKIEVF